jgi:ankyrin repeat protein
MVTSEKSTGALRPTLLAAALGLLLLATAGAGPASLPSAADRQLLQAVQQTNVVLIEVAIAAGADVNCPGTNGLPPLLELVRSATRPLDPDRRQCLACLLEHGAAVDPKDSEGRTPLIHAARVGDLETIRLLVDAQAYVMTRDHFHKSALFYAVEARRRDIVLYLANNGDLISLSVKERKTFHLPR